MNNSVEIVEQLISKLDCNGEKLKSETFDFVDEFVRIASKLNVNPWSPKVANYLDEEDPLSHLRDEFCIPEADGVEKIYFCGNSLGLQPKRTKDLMCQELDVWAKQGVLGFFDHPHGNPWIDIDKQAVKGCAKLCGALDSEIALMGTMTANLHFMLVSFYKPTNQRYKILVESNLFPSDNYAIVSQLEFHGYTDGVIYLKPRDGEHSIRQEDVMHELSSRGNEIALVLLPGLQYYSGQKFDIKTITKAAKKEGCCVGWNLAHSMGNTELKLHEWDVDFAVFCSYKYLNSGPYSIGGIFVHQKNSSVFRLKGWWGNREETRFHMKSAFDVSPGAAGFQLSAPSLFSIVSLISSLQVYDLVSFHSLLKKSSLLTSYLCFAIKVMISEQNITIITPLDSSSRGCQISILLKNLNKSAHQVLKALDARGIIVDAREPDVIRVTPVPLYNTFAECHTFVCALRDILGESD